MLDSAFTPLVVPRVGETPIDLRGEADRARTRGYADGFAEGRRLALDEAEAQRAAQQQRMQELQELYLHERGSGLRALEAAQAALDRRIDELSTLAADRVEELAVVLATTILGAELSDPARSAAHALRRALHEMPADRWTGVAFSVHDADVLQEEASMLDVLRGIRISASPAVDNGGAIVEIENGAVDTRISTALTRAAAALAGDDQDAGGTL
ncbi:FliH/SctL family protein [Microbacterium sp. APC 3901]|uniref:FliH/SctL family protein n=1 Tax=Microbacterium sp. APC 3901 TaxID=3035192 RepID=UPI0025B61782|nr:FliH/SctL family protein [Microbacterium sp. APC 3901]MDN3445409.1 FliH/SctL family protein [Microbacterium sp. APC 3901]